MENSERTVKQTIRVKLYPLIVDRLELAIAVGLRRAYKHSEDTLKEEAAVRIQEHIHNEVMSALDEIIDFGPTEQ